MEIKKHKVISIANIKGGVGKSTSSLIFATLLAKKYKVLLIDMDTQASTTSYFYQKLQEKNINIKDTNIYQVLSEKIDINESIVNLDTNLDFIPSYIDLHKFNTESIPLKEFRLKESLFLLEDEYEYIIIDTNPSLDYTLSATLISTHYIIVPMVAEKWAAESLELLYFWIKQLKINNVPVFLLITRFKNHNTHKQLLEYFQSQKRFLGFIHEREDLNKRIAKNDIFDLTKDYIKEYGSILTKFLNQIF
ncbi:chromosome partitioning protein ParA (plasmid) [Borrelia turcica IST7]|uniref:Chromosome partitioning protein ParA n=1 Tax=Borrelia turcica IST7 TaxID=1104446 RepID=A0A386PP20_9SPIR|nr:ParA family protein [Borrelia turcica]AYE36958.1 chromosome partitioning protein ParA [Borrelia turcica IST7]